MGNNTLEILINSRYSKTGVDGAKSGLGEFKNKLGSAVSELTGFTLGTLGAATALTTIATETKKAITEYIAYADQVRVATNLTGMQAEEASRLIQVSDDMGVEWGTLQTILEGANKKGFEPTIDNLADLADRFNAESDVITRNQLVTDALGKSGLKYIDVLKLGGNAIRERAAAVRDGNILDQEALDKALALKQAQDELTDSTTALKNVVAADLLPVLTAVFNVASGGIQVFEDLGFSLWDLTGIGPIVQGFKLFKGEVKDTGERARDTKDDLDFLNKSLEESAEAVDAVTISSQNLSTWLGGAVGNEIDAFREKQDPLISELQTLRGEIDLLNGKEYLTADQEQDLEAKKERLKEVETALGENADAHDEAMARIVYDLTAQKLAVDGYTDGEILALQELMDQLNLTDEPTKQLDLAIQSLTNHTTDENANNLAEAIAYIAEAAKDGKISAEDLATAMDILNGTHVDVEIEVSVTGDPIPDFGINDPDAPLPTEDEVEYGGMMAEGGSGWVTKPTMFVAGEAGIEHYDFTPLGGKSSADAGGGALINVEQMVVRNEMDIEIIAQRMAELIARRR